MKAALSAQCYASHMRELMEVLFNSSQTYDFKIVLHDGFMVQAHKEVLKASSGFFKNYLEKNCCGNPKEKISLFCVEYSDFIALLRFIYLGETQVASERFVHFIELGKKLEVKGIDIIEQEKVRNENPKEYETVNFETEDAKLSEGLAEQDMTRLENRRQHETVNFEMEYAKVPSDGLAKQEKIRKENQRQHETGNCEMDDAKVLSEGLTNCEIEYEGLAEQEKTGEKNQSKYETVNFEIENARMLSEGFSEQEKTEHENQSQYETVNWEIRNARVLPEGLHDQEEKPETWTVIKEDNYDYYQAMANKCSPHLP